MKINIYNSPAETIQHLADYFITIAKACVEDKGRFTVALSGGSSPKKLYELLSSEVYKNAIDWSKVYFFFGDERYVPLTDKESNYLMAKKALFEPMQIADDHVFAVDTSLPPDDAAQDYKSRMQVFFGNESIKLHLVLLGLGDNSHTASLFPRTTVLRDKVPAVKALFVEEINAYRVTMNAPMINNARHVAFLVYGKEKAVAVHHILQDKTDIEKYPAQLINPAKGELVWFLDNEAAKKVS